MSRLQRSITVTPASSLLGLGVGVLLGAALGVTVGMLFAPHKGTVTRREIRRKGEAVSDAIGETLQDSIDECEDQIAKGIETVKTALSALPVRFRR
jgi:gas vesicle protein